MAHTSLGLTYIGGPTALLEVAGLRLLTDPTFGAAGGEFPSGAARLHKLQAPYLEPGALGHIDAVLLSHDQHPDNLDPAGRALLPQAGAVLTTSAGAERLGGNSIGLQPWQDHDLVATDGRTLHVVATPARHGPADRERGPVIGFALQPADEPTAAIYVSGDTVWYEGVAEVARRFPVAVAILHLGAARVPEVGPFHLTMTADEAVEAARAFVEAVIVPVHFEGWAHFSEGRAEIGAAFEKAGLAERVRWPEPGRRMEVEL